MTPSTAATFRLHLYVSSSQQSNIQNQFRHLTKHFGDSMESVSLNRIIFARLLALLIKDIWKSFPMFTTFRVYFNKQVPCPLSSQHCQFAFKICFPQSKICFLKMCRRFPWDGCWVWVQPGLSKCGLLQKYCSELVLFNKCSQIIYEYVPYV